VAKAAPGEASFGAPIEVTDPLEDVLYDQPRLHIRGDGKILVSYMKYPKVNYESAIIVASSSDGQSFSRTTVSSGAGMRNFAFLCSGPEKQRIWIKYQDGGKGIVLAWSDDGGAQFPAQNSAVVQADDETNVFGMSTPGCVANGQDVWVIYGINAGVTAFGDNDVFSSIRLAHSSDGGSTIDTRIDVHDHASGSLFMFPEIVREDGGAIDIAYYAGASVADAEASFRTARSVDFQTFSPSFTVSSPLTLTADRGAPGWLGDYVGLAWQGGQLFSAFSDNASGSAHTAFWRATIP
jgi:hypothetical protein